MHITEQVFDTVVGGSMVLVEWINISAKETFVNLSKNLFIQRFYFISLIFNCSFNLVSFVFNFFTLCSRIIF